MELTERLKELVDRKFKTEKDGAFTISNFYVKDTKTVIHSDTKIFDLITSKVPEWIETLEEILVNKSFVPSAALVQSEKAIAIQSPISNISFNDIAELMKGELASIKEGKAIDHKKIKSITSLVNTTMNVVKTQIEMHKLQK